MLTISRPLSSGQAQRYHAEEFTSRTQSYYAEEENVRGEWQGRLAAIELLRLDRAVFSFTSFRHVEEDDVRVELRCRVAVNRPRGVVLEFCRRPVLRVLRRTIAAHARLDVDLHLVDRYANGFAMRLPNVLIAAGECRQ